ncbi:MAG: phosphoribosylformylglycinamidine cyclo-ligase [Spirochaetaceae bacterium]|jgi:phosphoribosylformylglycinamidine cyclo-ligase|nr:phosphoribosylformylglycinamidine cyclo-ligase [Spirochaetaceae bacterium]
MDYKTAGVHIEEGYRAVAQYQELAAGTPRRGVIGGIGAFGGLFSLKEIIDAGAGMKEPVLVAGADGVGTKLDTAFRMGVYDTVGIDCVAMCVNDILCHGAKPLFFLDYLACGKLDAAKAALIVKGVAAGCRESGAALLGGETAEMPGFYADNLYDIAGFALGIADRPRLIDGAAIAEGDALIGIASSGAHANGFSLIRRVIPDLAEDFGGMPLGRALLEPTRIYAKAVLELETAPRGMAHITGGGFYENIPRIFPPDSGLRAAITQDSWQIPPLFARIACGVSGRAPEKTGGAAQEAGMELLRADKSLWETMFRVFNMGIGFVLAVPRGDQDQALRCLSGRGYPAYPLGWVERAGPGGGIRFV